MHWVCIYCKRNSGAKWGRKAKEKRKEGISKGEGKVSIGVNSFWRSIGLFTIIENLEIDAIQVNLCQKLVFFHQLSHNMTTDCSLNYKFNTWNFKAQTKSYLYLIYFWRYILSNFNSNISGLLRMYELIKCQNKYGCSFRNYFTPLHMGLRKIGRCWYEAFFVISRITGQIWRGCVSLKAAAGHILPWRGTGSLLPMAVHIDWKNPILFKNSIRNLRKYSF